MNNLKTRLKNLLKRWWWILAVLIVVGVGTPIWLLNSGPPVTHLRMVQQLGDARAVDALRQELAAFESLHPEVRVELASDGAADVAVLAAYPTNPAAWAFPMTPWSGSLWVLAAHRTRLDALSSRFPAEVAALRAGTATPEQFTKLLDGAKTKTSAPLTLGNSHLWPFLLWLQAWTAATAGPEAAVLPTAGSPWPATLQTTMTELKKWRKAGWIDSAAWTQDWARGVAPLEKGQAIFALISQPLLSALSPTGRQALEFLPLPHRASDGPWSIGAAQFLARPAQSAHPAEADALMHFLTSPGVTTRLAVATGRPFFAWSIQTGRSPVVLADWATRVNDPVTRALAQDLAELK